jgi:hypothetical protein
MASPARMGKTAKTGKMAWRSLWAATLCRRMVPMGQMVPMGAVEEAAVAVEASGVFRG